MDIRRLTPADLDAVLRLVELAGWNQTTRDLIRLLRLEPDGCFAAWVDNRLVGTTTTTTYGTDLAWVGMVLVDPAYRRRGIATRLMETALDYLRWRGVKTIKLDATPAGRPVYEWLGFEAESTVERWAGTGVTIDERFGFIERGEWNEDVAFLDRRAFGADRSALMHAIIADSGKPLIHPGPFPGWWHGYALARRGRLAAYIGPVVAPNAATAWALVHDASAGLGRVFIDVDPAFPGATDQLRKLGFGRERELTRMRLGPPIAVERSWVFAIAGPEVG